MAYLLAAAAASGIFVAAGWRSKKVQGLAASQRLGGLPADPLWGEEEGGTGVTEAQGDVGSAIRVVLKRLGPIMASQSVQVEIACSPGMMVRMTSPALVELLEELLAASIHCAPTSRILMTATARGDCIYVGVTDDMPGGDHALRLGSIRGLIQRVAARGGALDINVRPTEGTTLTLRLAAAPGRERLAIQPAGQLFDPPTGFAIGAEP